MTIGLHTSRNNESRESIMKSLDPHAFSQKFTISEENNTLDSKDLFNFSPSITQREVSPITREEAEPENNFLSPKEEEEKQEEDPLTPQELEEYKLLQQRKAELELRMKQLEEKKLSSGKSIEIY